MAANDLLLQMAKESMNAIGNVLGEKINEGITLINSDDEQADFKSSCKKPVGTLKNIPDEVYREVMNSYYDALKEKDSGKVFDELTASNKNWTEKVKDVIGTLTRPTATKYVAIEDDDNYKISFPLSGVGVDSVALITQGKKFSVLNWDNEFFGKSSMFKYFLSLWNIEKKLSNEVLGACFTVLKTNAPDLLQAAYSSNSSNATVKEILGIKKSSIKSKVKSKIKNALPKNSYINNALTNYGTLTTYYNKLQKAINSSSSDYDKISAATENFLKVQNKIIDALNKNGVEFSAGNLPDVQDPINPYLKYNEDVTAASILSGHGNKLLPANYDTRIKDIYAADFTDSIEIVGNRKKNKIYGGLGNDTINGGKGKDSLWGGAGDDYILGGTNNDLIFGGEGADSLFGESGEDSIYGDADNDTIVGGNDDDILFGGEGNDLIFGEYDDDKIFGNDGNDILVGNSGSDELWGGAGADIFYYEKGDGRDTIFDYTAGEDKIYLASGSIDEIFMNSGNVRFKIGTGSITVREAADKEITFVFADNSESKYFNGEKVNGG